MFITFEGGEGSGKSTVIRAINEWLEDLGYSTALTREPGGCPVAEELRARIMQYDLSSAMESYYFAVARHIHLQERILPALNEGKVVLCDRYIDSSYVYQGFMRDRFTEVYWLNKEFKEPDLTIYLRVTPEVGLDRVQSRHGEVNRFDTQTIDYHYHLLEFYDECAKRFNRIAVVDADQDLEQVLLEVKEIITSKILDK